MPRKLSLLTLVALASFTFAAEPDVKIGAKIDDLRIKDIRGVSRSLKDLGEKKAFAFVFVDSSCPLVAKYMPALNRLDKAYRDKGVQLVAVNSGPNDTLTVMANQAVEFSAEFPFVKDPDCKVADALGVTRTPEVAVLDGKRVLRYRGRIDDQYRVGGQRDKSTTNDLIDALDAILAGKGIASTSTPVDGCVIPRPLGASDKIITYAEYVAPILAKHCTACHKPNTAAPFALQTFEQAKAKARTVADVVQDGRMPPWFAPKRDGDLIQHHSLSAAERETIVAWVKGGLARGDDSKLPKAVEEKRSKWLIGEPDFVQTTPPFELPTEGDIAYKYVILPHIFPADTWVTGVQILPSNPKAVHHANLAHYRLAEKFQEANFITGVVPGGEPMTVETGTAYKIPKGSMLAIQIHYVTTGKAEKVTLSVGLRYASGKIDRQMKHLLFVDTKYEIPAGASAHQVKVTRTLANDTEGIGLFAHMHLRGKAMSFVAHTPDGKTERLLDIPNYNFEWQIPYRWEPGKKVLPKGTKIECIALYDNSPFNPFNPDPTKIVKDGPQSYQEMLNGFMFFVERGEKLGLEIDGKTGTVKAK